MTSHIPLYYSTFWAILVLAGLDMIFLRCHTLYNYKRKNTRMKKHDKGLACHGHAAMGNMPWTSMTVTHGCMSVAYQNLSPRENVIHSPNILIVAHKKRWVSNTIPIICIVFIFNRFSFLKIIIIN